MKSRKASTETGLSLIEVLIAVAFVGICVSKGVVIMQNSRDVVSQGSASMIIEDQARVLLDRLALTVMSCDRRTLDPILSPGHSTEINYQVSLGIEDGDVVWGAPERINLGGPTNAQVLWFQSPALPEERKVVWSNDVRPLLEGELLNGIDDNGNGLVDEQGLSFSVEGNRVTIRLSLGRTSTEGVETTRSVSTTVTVRNNPVAP